MAPTLPTDNVLGSLYSASQLELGMAIADVMVATRDAGDVLTRPTGNVGTFYSESQLAIAMAIVDSMLANGISLGGGGGGGAIGDLDPIAANRLIGNPTGSSAAPSAIPLANSLSFVGGALSVATGGVQYGMLSNTTVAEAILGNPTTSPGAITQIQLGDGLDFILGELGIPDGSILIEKIEDLPADIVLGRLDTLGEPETLSISRDGNYGGNADEVVASMAAVEAAIYNGIDGAGWAILNFDNPGYSEVVDLNSEIGTLTNVGTGILDVNWSNTKSGTDYAVWAVAGSAGTSGSNRVLEVLSKTTSGFRVEIFQRSAYTLSNLATNQPIYLFWRGAANA